MDEKLTDSSWDDLLKQIGAAPAPDASQRRRPAIENPVEPPPNLPAPRKQKPGDWNALGSQLGLEPSAEEEAPVAAPRRRETPARSSPPAPPAGDIEAGFATIEPLESRFEEMIEEELTDVEFSEQDDSDLLAEGLDEPDDGPEGLSGEAARSAFEALFSAGSFSARSPQETPPQRREFRHDEPPRDLDAPARPPRRERSRDEMGERDDESRPDQERGEDDDGGDRPRRRRRRRGRGRGGRLRDDAATSQREGDAVEWSDETVGEAAPEEVGEERGDRDRDSDRGDRSRRGRSRRGRGGAASQSAESRAAGGGDGRPKLYREQNADGALEDDADEGSDQAYADDADEENGGADRSSHKGIPSWGDAIGVMVETNIQARKNSPQRGPSRERDRGGRGRGRGRGGRGGRGGGRGKS